jgi:hypothetical protein
MCYIVKTCVVRAHLLVVVEKRPAARHSRTNCSGSPHEKSIKRTRCSKEAGVLRQVWALCSKEAPRYTECPVVCAIHINIES